VPNSVFTNAIDDILNKNKYTDTTQSIFRSKTNSMLLSAKVSRLKFKYITSPNRVTLGYTVATDYFVIAELTVEWSLLDIYEQPKYVKTIVSNSGEFVNHYNFDANAYGLDHIFSSINDALTSSFYNFLGDHNVRNLLAIDTKKETVALLKILPDSNSEISLKSAQASTVTISTKNGHGSGCLINTQGYLITNYHVIAGAKEPVEVLLSTGDKYKGTIVRTNEDADLALILIENAPTDLKYFELPKDPVFEVGDEVFAIGTPKSIELSQTLSKGIISGLRKRPDNIKLIQTDVSVNPGNSGGALVSKDGRLIGIVNSKLMGPGIEGIAFCLSASEIRKALSLE
jgi:serine protease Do